MKEEKLTRFINDPEMSQAVYKHIEDEFLHDQLRADVNVLAAERLAIRFLQVAWKKLEQYRVQEKKSTAPGNVGL